MRRNLQHEPTPRLTPRAPVRRRPAHMGCPRRTIANPGPVSAFNEIPPGYGLRWSLSLAPEPRQRGPEERGDLPRARIADGQPLPLPSAADVESIRSLAPRSPAVRSCGRAISSACSSPSACLRLPHAWSLSSTVGLRGLSNTGRRAPCSISTIVTLPAGRPRAMVVGPCQLDDAPPAGGPDHALTPPRLCAALHSTRPPRHGDLPPEKGCPPHPGAGG